MPGVIHRAIHNIDSQGDLGHGDAMADGEVVTTWAGRKRHLLAGYPAIRTRCGERRIRTEAEWNERRGPQQGPRLLHELPECGRCFPRAL